MKQLQNASLRSHYIRLLSLGIIFILLLNTALYLYVNHEQEELENQYFILQEKKDVFNNLSLTLNQIFFRARGYYSFKNEQELQLAYQELESFNIFLDLALAQELNTNEEKVLKNLQEFMIAYEDENLPKAIEFVQQNDYEGLQEFSRSGINTAVNEFNLYTTELDDNLEIQLEDVRDEIFTYSRTYSLLVYISLSVILLALAFYVWQTIRGIVKPIENLSSAVKNFTDGNLEVYEPLRRSDEIGILSNTFSSMFKAIRSNEDELKNRNSQLLDQQKLMLDSQQQLEQSLTENEIARNRIERYNELNRQISVAIARQDVAERTIRYFCSAYKVDHGIIWFSEDDEYGAYQMTDEMIKQFLTERKAYIEKRLEQQDSVLLTRSAKYAGGIVPFESPIYEFYVRIHHTTGQTIYAAFARGNEIFTAEEQQDIQIMLERLLLVLDRIRLFEENVQERILNENIVNNISEGIQYVDETESIIQRNEAFCNLFGSKPDGLEQKIPKQFWLEGLVSKVVEKEELREFLVNCLREKKHESQSMTYTIDSPSQKVVQVYSTPIYNQQEYTGTVFVHRDITQQYEVDQMKTELVSTVSHELRTPLSSILGFTELLLYKENKPEKQKRYLETIQKETSRLTNLINDFLDIQRMESGQQNYHFEEQRMEEILLESIERFAVDEAKPIVFTDLSTQSLVRIDKERILQTLMNLISNARKFSPDGGTIQIKMETAEDQVRISIKDQGIGIPPQDIPKLFKKFSRIDNSTQRKIGGTGLGLAICQEIVKEHNGSIWIESEEGVGTTVWLTLPLVENLKQNRKQEQPKSSLEETPLILLVEDDVSMLTLMAEELKHHGCRIMYATTIQEAQNALKNQIPDLIVLDLVLQGETTGWKLVEQLQESPVTATIPILISSAFEPKKDYFETLQIADYLVKPYPPERLSQTVFMILKNNPLV